MICPSNPYLSVDPLLAVPGMREQLQRAVDNGETRLELDSVREQKAHKVTLRWHDR